MMSPSVSVCPAAWATPVVEPAGLAPTPAVAPAPNPPKADDDHPGAIWEQVLRRVSLGTRWYLGYRDGMVADERVSAFRIGRGYLTARVRPLPWIQARVTLDAHQNDDGEWAARLKYLHAKLTWPTERWWISDPYLEMGIAHTPWFDFEEHINRYRMEGTMFIERAGLLNSADLGLAAGALIGRKLSKSYRKNVNKAYPGLWGSVAIGLYNGGGYHAAEANTNKVLMSRVSLRPLGPWLPGLQLSHFFIHGKGNTADAPDWWLHDGMVSFEHRLFALTGQVAVGAGNQQGTLIDGSSNSIDFFGVFVFRRAPAALDPLGVDRSVRPVCQAP